jgi:hypothetical protein
LALGRLTVKVRLFVEETLPQKFDERINEFLSSDKINVVDIKFSTTVISGAVRLYALLLYEEAS